MSLPATAILRAPSVFVLSRPAFAEAPHLGVQWVGESTDGERLSEYAGRLCSMSQDNPARRETRDFLQNVKVQGDGSVLEHAHYSVLIEGISQTLAHALMRHPLGFAFSQLSERHRDDDTTRFVMPPSVIGDAALEAVWIVSIENAVLAYRALFDRVMGKYTWLDDRRARRRLAHEAAASVLPGGVETKLVVTGNVRSWRNLLDVHGRDEADLELRRLSVVLFRLLQTEGPAFFSDIEVWQAGDRREALRVLHRNV